jgi:hypothetical protein
MTCRPEKAARLAWSNDRPSNNRELRALAKRNLDIYVAYLTNISRNEY